jgi:DNA primase
VKRVNAYDAYLSGRADIRYDFKRNRVVFLVKDGNKVVDAAGRSIDGRTPKWYRYGSSKSPFVSGTNLSVACVVEDCASACSISGIVTGVGILGTNLLTEHIDVLKQYDRVFIALDKDATDKAIGMVRTLHTHVPTRLMVLRTDLKNMQGDERDDFIRSYIDR